MEFLDLKNGTDYSKLKDVANALKNGELVLFPTETVYGLGANGLNEEAVKRIYEVKNRSRKKPINLLVCNMEMIEELAQDISVLEYKLMKTFFPGPFTIILKKKKIVPDIVTAGLDTVGVRMPSGVIAQKLVELSGVPVATPSANLSGEPSGINLNDILEEFKDKVDYAIDGGTSELGIASTIVKVIDDVPHVLRIGKITPEQIKKVAGNVVVSC